MRRLMKLNENGMVLMTVLMIVMVMMIFTITILTQSLNQSTSTQKQIDQIKQDQLAKGIFWQIHSAGGDVGLVNKEATMDGRVYNSTVRSSGSTYTIDVSSQ